MNKALTETDAVWEAIARGWDIEPREYFERAAPKNGFRFPLLQALHHIWKREPKPKFAAKAIAALDTATHGVDRPFQNPVARKLDALVCHWGEGGPCASEEWHDAIRGLIMDIEEGK